MQPFKWSLPIIILLASGCAPLPARDDPWSGRDKLNHFGASALIAAAAVQSEKNRGADDCQALRFGFVLSSGVGVSKEMVDATIRKTGWSWRDLVMDGLGALAGGWIVAPCHDD